MIIGITGKMQSGKDTLATILQHRLFEGKDTYIKSMADPLKRMCMMSLGLDRDDVYTQEGKARYNHFWGMTNREILQKVGTDAMRRGFCDDVWIKLMYKELMLHKDHHIIIPDIRFNNEAQLVKDLGGVMIRVERDIYQISEHVSEQDVDLKYIDTIILNHGTIDELKKQAINIVNTIM